MFTKGFIGWMVAWFILVLLVSNFIPQDYWIVAGGLSWAICNLVEDGINKNL